MPSNIPAAVIPISIDMSNVPRQFAAGINAAQAAARPIQLKIDSRPLGKISGDLKEFDKSLASSNARVIAFGATTGILYGVSQAFSEIVSTTINVEKKLQDINVILQASNQNFSKLRSGLFDIAIDTGKSFDEAATAAAEFSRQGLGLQETLRRTKDALTLSRLAAIDSKESVSDLTAAINTFNKEALDSTTIVNKLATVDAAFAVSSADLAEAIKRAGASAADAGVNFDKLLAAVTSVQQTTARGGAVIGNAFKSIFTRVERSTNLETLRQLGVTIKDVEGNTRPAIDILEDFSKVYVTLGDAQKAQVSEQLAGIQQINILKALLNDLSRANSFYTASLNVSNKATDEAIRRNEELNTSTSALINKTKANIGNLFSGLGAGSIEPALRGILNAFNGVFDKLKSALGSTNLDEAQKGVGERIGRGIIDGISGIVSGPGLTVLVAVFGRLFLKVGEFVGKAGLQLAGINKTAEDQAKLQGNINALLANGNTYYQERINSAKSLEERERVILSIMQQENALLQASKAFGAATASSLYNQGKRGGEREGGQQVSPFTSPGEGILRGLYRRPIAGGYLPDMVEKERAAVSRGVGGASSSAKPVLIPNFNFGGGKTGDVVANTNEYIVKNFAGGSGSAVFNPNMVRNIGGLDKLSGFGQVEKIGAEGIIPNYGAESFLKALNSLKNRKAVGTLRSQFDYPEKGGVKAQFNDISKNTVRLDDLEALVPGKGAATAFMADVIGLAKQHRTNITLRAQPYGKEQPLDLDQLKSFYQKFGFKPIGKEIEMRGYPDRKSIIRAQNMHFNYRNAPDGIIPDYADIPESSGVNKYSLFAIRDYLRKNIAKVPRGEKERYAKALIKIEKRLDMFNGKDAMGASGGFVPNFTEKVGFTGLAGMLAAIEQKYAAQSVVRQKLSLQSKLDIGDVESAKQAAKELGLVYSEKGFAFNTEGLNLKEDRIHFQDPVHGGNIDIKSGSTIQTLIQERDFKRKLFDSGTAEERDRLIRERELADPEYAAARKASLTPGYAKGYVPNFNSIVDTGLGSELKNFYGNALLERRSGKTLRIGGINSNFPGQGFSKFLYEDIFHEAKKQGYERVTGKVIPQLQNIPKNDDSVSKLKARYPQLTRARLGKKSVFGIGKKEFTFTGDKFDEQLAANADEILSISTKEPTASLTSFLAGGFPKGLKDALNRESKYVSPSSIYVDKDARLKTSDNPEGLLVANKKDEPLGGFQGVNRAIKEGQDPNSYGSKPPDRLTDILDYILKQNAPSRNLANGLVPNFANPPLVPGTNPITNNPLVQAGGIFESLSIEMQKFLEKKLNEIKVKDIDFTKGADDIRRQLRDAIKKKLGTAVSDLDLERTPEGVRLSKSINRLVNRTADTRQEEFTTESGRQGRLDTRALVRREFLQAQRAERDAKELQRLQDQLAVGENLSPTQKGSLTRLTRKNIESSLDPKFLALKSGDQYDQQLFEKVINSRVKITVGDLIQKSADANATKQIGSFFGQQTGILQSFRSAGTIQNKFEAQTGRKVSDLTPQQQAIFQDNLAATRRENIGRRQQFGLGASFALPFLASTATSAFSIGRDQQGNLTPGGRRVQGAVEGLSVGASIAGLLPTPVGIGIGAAAGALIALKAATENLTKNFEEFSREVDESSKKTSERADAVTQGIQSFENFKEVVSSLRTGEGKPITERATRQVVQAFQQVPQEFKPRFLAAAANDITGQGQPLADLQEEVINSRNISTRTAEATKRIFNDLDKAGTGSFFGGSRGSTVKAFDPNQSTGISGFFTRARFNLGQNNPFTNPFETPLNFGRTVRSAFTGRPDIREQLGGLQGKDLAEIKEQVNLLPVTAEGAQKGIDAAPRILKLLKDNKITPESGVELFLKASGTDELNAKRFAEVFQTANFADTQQVIVSKLKSFKETVKADDIAKSIGDVQQKVADFSTITSDILKDLSYNIATANTQSTRQKNLKLQDISGRIDIAAPTLAPNTLSDLSFKSKTLQNEITSQNDIGEAVSKGIEKIKLPPAVLQDAQVADTIAKSIKEAAADPSKINEILEKIATSVDSFNTKRGSGQQLGVQVRADSKDIAKDVQNIVATRDDANNRARLERELDLRRNEVSRNANLFGGDFTKLKNFDFTPIIKGIQAINQIPLNKPIINNRFNPLTGQIERGQDFRAERGRSIEQGTDIVTFGKQLSQLGLLRPENPQSEKFRQTAQSTIEASFNDLLDRFSDLKGASPEFKDLIQQARAQVKPASEEQAAREFQRTTPEDAINNLIKVLQEDIASIDKKNDPLFKNTEAIVSSITSLDGLHEGTSSLVKANVDLQAAIEALTAKLEPLKNTPGVGDKDSTGAPVTPNKVSGFIPNFNAYVNELSAIKKGVGGARAGDIPSFANIRGLGPSVVNTGETIIRNFMDTGKDAVFNREMKKSFGGSLSLLGRPENAFGGYVPNFISPANDVPFGALDYSRGPLANLKIDKKKEVVRRPPQISISTGKTEELYKKMYLDKDGYYKVGGHIPNFANEDLPPGLPDHYYIRTGKPKALPTPSPTATPSAPYKATSDFAERKYIESLLAATPTPAPTAAPSPVTRGASKAELEAFDKAIQKNNEESLRNKARGYVPNFIFGSEFQRFINQSKSASSIKDTSFLKEETFYVNNPLQKQFGKISDSDFVKRLKARSSLDTQLASRSTTGAGLVSKTGSDADVLKRIYQSKPSVEISARSGSSLERKTALAEFDKLLGYDPTSKTSQAAAFERESKSTTLNDILSTLPKRSGAETTRLAGFDKALSQINDEQLAKISPKNTYNTIEINRLGKDGYYKEEPSTKSSYLDKDGYYKEDAPNKSPYLDKDGYYKASGYVPNFITSLNDALASSSSLRDVYNRSRSTPLNTYRGRNTLDSLGRYVYGLRQNYIPQNNPQNTLSSIGGQPRLPLSLNEIPDLNELNRFPFLVPENSGLFKRRRRRREVPYEESEGAKIGDRVQQIAARSGNQAFSDFIFKVLKGKNPDYATGFGPNNFPTGYIPGLTEALARESGALSRRGITNPEKHLFVGKSSGILGVGNTIDERDGLLNPNAGIQQGINRYIKDGLNPSTAGLQAANFAPSSDNLLTAINNLITKLGSIADNKDLEGGQKTAGQGNNEVRHTGNFSVDVALKGGENANISKDVISQVQAAVQAFKTDINNRLSSLEKSNGQIPTPPRLQSSSSSTQNDLLV